MKSTAKVSLHWGDDYGRPPKSPAELARDQQRVKAILERIGYGAFFTPDSDTYSFELPVGSRELEIWIEELQQDPHLAGSYNSVTTVHSKHELAQAKLLWWRPTNQAIEKDCYDPPPQDPEQESVVVPDRGQAITPEPPYQRCPECGAPLRQVRDLMLDAALMGKRDISGTYIGEMIISERVASILHESGLSGFGLRPVRPCKKLRSAVGNLHQLVATNVLPPMASPPTKFAEVHLCALGHHKSRFLDNVRWWGKIKYRADPEIYYSREQTKWEDFNYTNESFGAQRAMYSDFIISSAAYQFLQQHQVKGWDAVPVHLI